MKPSWIETFEPEILEDTGNYVRMKTPPHVFPVKELPYFCEHLRTIGYRYLAADAAQVVCEKITPINWQRN